MNIYDFAFEMEKDSETYYKNLANKATDEGFKKILTMLAVEEKKHQYYIAELKKNNNVKQVDSTLLKDVKNIFASMRDKEEDISINVSQVELYQKAQELEKKTEIFYIEKSETAKSKAEKNLLKKLASIAGHGAPYSTIRQSHIRRR
jgi:rubrerythrin